jgi:hypothetical protein
VGCGNEHNFIIGNFEVWFFGKVKVEEIIKINFFFLIKESPRWIS